MYIVAILLGICLLLGVVLVVMLIQHDEIVGLIVGLLLILGVGSLVIGMQLYYNNELQDYYKQGQIDAITGDIRYELHVNRDSTRTWRLIQQEP